MSVSIFIAQPAYGGQVFANAARSMTLLTHALRERGFGFAMSYTIGESLIPRGRNTLVHSFLKSDCTHLLFLDADIEFDPGHVLAMIDADKDLVGGAYPKKTINRPQVIAAALRGEQDPMQFAGEFVVNIDPKAGNDLGDGSLQLRTDKGCVPVLEVGTGFLLTKRHVFFDMAKAYPDIAHVSDAKDTFGETIHAWFDCQLVADRVMPNDWFLQDGVDLEALKAQYVEQYIGHRRYLSEDYLFCRRWREMGGTVWLYLPAKLSHIGTHVYTGDLFSVFKPDAPRTASEWSDIPELPDADPQKRWHLFRYSWAAERIRGTRVANAACGSGYGNAILGNDVVGFDRSEECIALAKSKYSGEFVQCDIEEQRFEWFDTVVSLETFEHLKDPVGWLSRLSDCVTELVLSAPIIPTKHTNPHHLHDFTAQELRNIVRAAGWTILEEKLQDEWVPGAVLLIHATRPAKYAKEVQVYKEMTERGAA